MEGITRKQFDEFCDKMWERLKIGEKKYGVKYDKKDIKKELEDELIDVANYAFMWKLKTGSLDSNT